MTNSPNLPEDQQDDEISLLELLTALAKHKLLILGLPVVVAVITAGYSLTLPSIFTATTKIMQPQGPSGVSATLAQLASLGGLVGGGGSSGVRNPNDVFIAMLKSRTVADSLNQRFDLSKRWSIDKKFSSVLYEELEKVTKITSSKDGVIAISVENTDPRFAADLANAYVEELTKFSGVLAVTESSQRRLFFERQFALAKDNLAKAEVQARQALQSGGLVKVDDQGRAMVEATARLRGQISVKEVQISAMRSFAAERNPDLVLAQRELEAMKAELGRIEGTGGLAASTKGQNDLGSDNLRLLREVKYREAIFELLARQYEIAKLEESKDSNIIQVMDKAIEPDRRSKPQRTQMVLLAAFVAFLFSVFWVLAREIIGKSQSDPKSVNRLLDLKRSLLSWK